METPTPHYTNTCVKQTIVTYLSFNERIVIANLSYMRCKKICRQRRTQGFKVDSRRSYRHRRVDTAKNSNKKSDTRNIIEVMAMDRSEWGEEPVLRLNLVLFATRSMLGGVPC